MSCTFRMLQRTAIGKFAAASPTWPVRRMRNCWAVRENAGWLLRNGEETLLEGAVCDEGDGFAARIGWLVTQGSAR